MLMTRLCLANLVGGNEYEWNYLLTFIGLGRGPRQCELFSFHQLVFVVNIKLRVFLIDAFHFLPSAIALLK